MKKRNKVFAISLLMITVALYLFNCGCGIATSDYVEDGIYFCENPYIKIEFKNGNVDYNTIPKIEYEGVTYDAVVNIGYTSAMRFTCYDENTLQGYHIMNPEAGLFENERRGHFSLVYSFKEDTKQLIFRDGNKFYVLNDIS